MRAKGGYIYIVSNKNRTVLYIGVTSDLYQRIWQHKNGMGSVFTNKYNCTDILYYEFFSQLAKDQVPFPVARYGSVCGLGGTVRDGDHALQSPHSESVTW